VDVHCLGDGHWSFGLLLRRSDGSTVGAATRSLKGSVEATFGEALSLNDAIDMA
jgi:hypothetical protein